MSPRIVPLRQFVLKVHSRCDLACNHCYVYQGADQSWQGKPMAMTDETIAWTAQRIAEHAKSHRLAVVHAVLHGGEPLLAGRDRLGLITGTLRSALADVCDLDLRIHTNGVLLDEEFCELFDARGVKVGISVDGYRAANDRHRRYADGRSSYEQVIRAIARLRTARYRHLYAGLLCTIDVANDPAAVYESLLDLDPPRIDFLLPHATWDEPPVRPAGSGAATAYADWLITIFDRWLADGRPVGIRTFESIMETAVGGDSRTEALGLAPSDLVVIETDGSYEQADSLKTAFDGAPATGFDVFTHSLDAVGQHPGIVARQQGLDGLCQTCRACPVVTSCGGGLYAHRYRPGTGFANPSVYCADLLKLVSHIGERIGQPAIDSARASPAGTHAGAGRAGSARAVSGHVDSAHAGSAHAIPAADFRALAAGLGGSDAIGHLVGAQRSLGRALVAAVFQEAASASVPGTDGLNLRAAWDLLTGLDQDSPHELEDVLAHPYARVWAVRCMERLRTPSAERSSGSVALAADLGHLGAIAATAAIRSGAAARLTVPVLHGAVHLPALGRLVVSRTKLPPEVVSAVVTVEAADGGVTVRTQDDEYCLNRTDLLAGQPGSCDHESAIWEPVRRMAAPGISLLLEDSDPYRDCHQWTAAPRLSDAEYNGWQRGFRDAWALIRQDHSAYAPGLAAGLRTITPLSAAPAGRELSATARHAFGAVAAALPDDYATLALLLIHEFQHVKLGAVLDLYDLYDAADSRLFRAPWREDPRPLEGLLQGAYAHLAVTDFWRARQHAAVGHEAEKAEAHFAHWSGQTAGAIEDVATSGSLTPIGKQFVDRMRASITAMIDEPASASRPGNVAAQRRRADAVKKPGTGG